MAAKTTASPIASGAIAIVHPADRERTSAAPYAKATPRIPPVTQSVVASKRNCSSTAPRVAPSALRTPISFVRSVTDTNMMFMMPMPPTRRLTAAIPASSMVKVCVVS